MPVTAWHRSAADNFCCPRSILSASASAVAHGAVAAAPHSCCCNWQNSFPNSPLRFRTHRPSSLCANGANVPKPDCAPSAFGAFLPLVAPHTTTCRARKRCAVDASRQPRRPSRKTVKPARHQHRWYPLEPLSPPCWYCSSFPWRSSGPWSGGPGMEAWKLESLVEEPVSAVAAWPHGHRQGRGGQGLSGCNRRWCCCCGRRSCMMMVIMMHHLDLRLRRLLLLLRRWRRLRH
jgi:hypothetical protein